MDFKATGERERERNRKKQKNKPKLGIDSEREEITQKEGKAVLGFERRKRRGRSAK